MWTPSAWPVSLQVSGRTIIGFSVVADNDSRSNWCNLCVYPFKRTTPKQTYLFIKITITKFVPVAYLAISDVYFVSVEQRIRCKGWCKQVWMHHPERRCVLVSPVSEAWPHSYESRSCGILLHWSPQPKESVVLNGTLPEVLTGLGVVHPEDERVLLFFALGRTGVLSEFSSTTNDTHSQHLQSERNLLLGHDLNLPLATCSNSRKWNGWSRTKAGQATDNNATDCLVHISTWRDSSGTTGRWTWWFLKLLIQKWKI